MIKNIIFKAAIIIVGIYLLSSGYFERVVSSNPEKSVIKQKDKMVINEMLANEIDPMCNIIVYTSVNCKLCKAAVDALESTGARYCQKDINQSDKNSQTYDQLSGGEVCGPIAVIGNKVLKGFSYKYSKKSYSRAVDKLNTIL